VGGTCSTYKGEKCVYKLLVRNTEMRKGLEELEAHAVIALDLKNTGCE
jgi:hypothetical protein